ncbi:MAG: hypothetical protein AAB975_01880, partial [Patescibacteria group bacterium]
NVPHIERLDLRYSARLAGASDGIITYVPWRAAVKFFKISTDKIIGRKVLIPLKVRFLRATEFP